MLDQLSQVTKGEIESVCRNIPPSFEPRKGLSSVMVLRDGAVVTLLERGKWLSVLAQDSQEISYTNTLRFRSLERGGGRILLEHLRYGESRPIPLFELDLVGPHFYRSLTPYQCREDTYTGSILFEDHRIHLNWQVIGPKKNISLRAVYTQASQSTS